MVVTFNTGFPASILDGKVFPFLNITKTVITVCEVPAMNTEVIGNQKLAGNEDRADQSDRYPQRAQYMPLHCRLPRCSYGTDQVYELLIHGGCNCLKLERDLRFYFSRQLYEYVAGSIRSIRRTRRNIAKRWSSCALL